MKATIFKLVLRIHSSLKKSNTAALEPSILSTLLRSIDEYGFHFIIMFCFNFRTLQHFTNLSLPSHIFYKDEEEKKPTVFKTIPSFILVCFSATLEASLWPWLWACCSLLWPLSLPHCLDRGRQKVCL